MIITEYPDGKTQQPLPLALASRKDDIQRFQDLCDKVRDKVLKLFALALKVRFPTQWGLDYRPDLLPRLTIKSMARIG